MPSGSELHEPGTNAEQSETGGDFRVSYESEEWRPVTIERIAHLYEVSSEGRVRSYRSGAARLLTPQPSGDGYWRIGLWDGELQTKYPIHRLVALAFLADSKNALHRQVAHLDGSRTNNQVGNLKWVSHAENMSHKRQHGTLLIGSKHPRAQLSEAQVVELLGLLGTPGWSYTLLAKRYGVTRWTIEDVRTGKNWRHIARPPELLKRLSKGLSQEGASNHNARLTWDQAAEFRSRYRLGERCAVLAVEFGIGKAAAYKLLAGDTYRTSPKRRYHVQHT